MFLWVVLFNPKLFVFPDAFFHWCFVRVVSAHRFNHVIKSTPKRLLHDAPLFRYFTNPVNFADPLPHITQY